MEKHPGNNSEPSAADIMKLKISDKVRIRALQLKERGQARPQQQQAATTPLTAGPLSKKAVVSTFDLQNLLKLDQGDL